MSKRVFFKVTPSAPRILELRLLGQRAYKSIASIPSSSLNKAAGLDPDNEKAWYSKALVHHILRQHDEAYRCILRALHINPNYEHAKRLKELLDKMLKQ
jgi:tetratricopeptide (TPR) repeat protein